MTQNTEQNVRTRDEQAAELVSRINDMTMDYPSREIPLALKEAEARGAAEQRRKDGDKWAATQLLSASKVIEHKNANVAALEAEIASLKEAEQLARADAEASKARGEVFRAILNNLLETDCIIDPSKPRILDLCYTAFMRRVAGKNPDDGGHCDWFNDTRPQIIGYIENIRAALTREGGV